MTRQVTSMALWLALLAPARAIEVADCGWRAIPRRV